MMEVSWTEKHKHVGMILDSRLSLSVHIPAAITKLKKEIRMLKFMPKYLSRSALDEFFKFYVRSHLNCGNLIYQIPKNDDAYSGNYHVEKLELSSIRHLERNF